MLPKQNKAGDLPPAFHEWATIQPGMIVLARKKRTAQYRQFHAAETAMPVIGCAECLGPDDEPNFFFAGVCRSKTVRTPDDGIGPSVDEARRANCNFERSSPAVSPRDFACAVFHLVSWRHGDAAEHVERLDLRR